MLALALVLAGAVLLAATVGGRADAQSQTIKIGTLFDHTGPFAAAGSLNVWRGAKMIIDYTNEKGGILGKYKLVQVDGDSQSKAEVAINEAERLLNVEKVDILAGVYSSAHAVPLAEKVDRQKRFLWITTAISSKVFDGRNLQYTFRPQPTGVHFGELSMQYIVDYSKDKLGKDVKDLRVAVIYEDGPYGADVALGNETRAKDRGVNVVLKEGYSASAPDLSALVTKLRAARPDVLFHTGYNPDISLFLRQSKEQGLRLKAYIGHGAGHSQLDKLKEAFGKEVEFFHTVDPIASQLIASKLKPPVSDMTAEMVKRYQAQFDKQSPVEAIAPSRLDGLQQPVDPLQRRAAAGHREARGVEPGRAGQGGPGDGHPRGRHHAGLRREVLPARPPVRRAERARLPGGLPGDRGKVRPRLSEERRHGPADPAVAGVLAVRRPLSW